MNKKPKDLNKKKMLEILIKKLRIVRYDVMCKDKCEFSREYFYTSIPAGEVGGKMSYKLIDLLQEFPNTIKEFCKTHNLIVKSNKSNKILYFINKKG